MPVLLNLTVVHALIIFAYQKKYYALVQELWYLLPLFEDGDEFFVDLKSPLLKLAKDEE